MGNDFQESDLHISNVFAVVMSFVLDSRLPQISGLIIPVGPLVCWAWKQN